MSKAYVVHVLIMTVLQWRCSGTLILDSTAAQLHLNAVLPSMNSDCQDTILVHLHANKQKSKHQWTTFDPTILRTTQWTNEHQEPDQ